MTKKVAKIVATKLAILVAKLVPSNTKFCIRGCCIDRHFGIDWMYPSPKNVDLNRTVEFCIMRAYYMEL